MIHVLFRGVLMFIWHLGKRLARRHIEGSLLCGPSRDGDAVLVEAVFSMCSNKKSTEVTF